MHKFVLFIISWPHNGDVPREFLEKTGVQVDYLLVLMVYSTNLTGSTCGIRKLAHVVLTN